MVKNHLTIDPTKTIDSKEINSKTVLEIKKDLKTNPLYKEFFEKYHHLSVEAFIENYAIKKSRYITYGEMLNQIYENAYLRRQVEAEERLWEIQKKKLFNLECQWRADLIKIPQIEISYDFEYWEKNIENCPFLPPISQDEFELYIKYISNEDFYDFKLEYKWMNYKDIKENYSEYGTLPPWFEFYDLHFGTGSLLELPDIRGEKEEFYLNLWRMKNSEEKRKEKRKRVTENDSRPFLKSYDKNVIENFIKKFEDEKILQLFRIYEGELNKSNDEVERAIRLLKEADEIIPIESNFDWRSAVILAARKFEQRKIIEALHNVYEKYKYRLKIGIAQEVHAQEDNIVWIKEWSEDIKKKIIQARIINNEPADLNL